MNNNQLITYLLDLCIKTYNDGHQKATGSINKTAIDKITIDYENTCLNFWFDQSDIRPRDHFNELIKIQNNRYGGILRFANNNQELLNNKYWKSMLSAIIKRLKEALGIKCRYGIRCKYYDNGRGWCRNPH